MRVLSEIAGKVLSCFGNSAVGSGVQNAPSAPHRMIPSQIALVAAVSAAALAGILLAGASWALALPVTAAVFALILICVIAVREYARGAASPRPNAPQPEAPAFDIDAILDTLPGLVTRHDSAGQLVSVHGAAAAEYGLAGNPSPAAFFEAIHVGGRVAFLRAVDALRQGAAFAEVEFLISCGGLESGFRPVRMHLRAELREGRFAGFIGQTFDISREAELRAEAERYRREAEHSNDAKTRFLAAVSHELRTPLNAILGFSDILIGEYFGAFANERQKEYACLINQSGHHLLAVVNTMLDMSKIEAGRYQLVKEPFDIAAAIRAVEDMLALQAKNKGVILTTRVARGLGEVVADRRAMQQILINLANNAIKFTEEGGVVTIDATVHRNELKILVSDTGIGIPAEKLAEIGKPFMQVQSDYARRYEGTGLGLALVKGLVALHGGSFTIESTEGVGTAITVCFPLDGETDAGAETFEFPPRLHEPKYDMTGEKRHGPAEAKIA